MEQICHPCCNQNLLNLLLLFLLCLNIHYLELAKILPTFCMYFHPISYWYWPIFLWLTDGPCSPLADPALVLIFCVEYG